MRVAVDIFGPLRKHVPDDGRTVHLDVLPNTTVGDLLPLLGIDPEEPWNASLNGTLATASDVLTEGSIIIMFPPIAGGSLTAERVARGVTAL